jgi:CHAD domain-containing protein
VQSAPARIGRHRGHRIALPRSSFDHGGVVSEQHVTTALGEAKLRLPELMRDTRADAVEPAREIEEMFTAVRQQLSELTAALRVDLEELRRLVGSEPPTAANPLPSGVDSREPEPFRLQRREPMAAGVRRIVCGQIDAALADLDASAFENPSEAIHACRKRFKRVRAVARLVRSELGEDSYRLENVVFRDLGRRFSGARDSQASLETLEILLTRYAREIPPEGLDRFRAALVHDAQAAELRLRERIVAGEPVVEELRAARARVAAWRLRDDVSALAGGFERTYRRGRRAFIAARRDPTEESLHELRKRAKDLWHAAQILRPTAPKTMKALAERAHRLSDLLGVDHDLAVLSQQAGERPECLAGEREAALLHALIDRHRRRVQHDAIKLGERIFAAKPRKLARPVRRAGATPAR